MTLSENIVFYRKRKGYTQKELAERLQVKPTTVSAWELGNNKPRASMLEKLANIFGVSVDDLLGTKSDGHLTVKEALDGIMSSDGKGIREADKPILEAIISKYLAEAK